ncbi:MAG: hypothetical protein K2H96_10890 [Muribaculaceae bacterium]|nr:hypothetical protein [Muribaculaceae bacterium]
MRNFTISSMLLGIAMTMSVSAFGATTSIPEDYRVEPEPGSTVEVLTQITVVNAEGDEISNYGNKIKINNVDYTTSPKTDYNKVTFVLDTPITENGEYDIVIPQGRIVDEYMDDIDEFQFTVIVKSGDDPGDDTDPAESIIPKGFTVTPTPGSEVSSISEIKLTYDDDWTELSLVKKVIEVDGEEVAVNGYGDFGELTLILVKKITEAGDHHVVIPAGTFELDSMDESELFSFTLKVDGTETPEDPEQPDEPGDDEPGDELAGIPSGFSVSPANNATVEELTTITIVDDNYGDMSVNEGAKLYVDGVSVEYTAKVEGEYDDTLILTLVEKITDDGEHTIQLPAGFFNYMFTSASKAFGWTVKIEGTGNDQPDQETTLIPEGVTVIPAADATVASITSISVSIEGWGELYYMDKDYLFINGEESKVKEGYGDPVEIRLNTPIETEGTYWITIPANSIMNDMGKYLEEPIQFSVKVEPGVMANVDEISGYEETEAMIYTIDGILVDKMQADTVYIIRKGSKVYKTVVK